MKKTNFLCKAFLLLALLGGASSAWADTKPTITGITLPDAPSSTLNLDSQTDFTPDENDWIVFSPKADGVNSKGYWTCNATNGNNRTWAKPDGATAPFVGSGGSDKTSFALQTARVHALRFTGAESFSVLGKSGGTGRYVHVALYTYNGSTFSLVDDKSDNSNNAVELLFTSLSSSTSYVAYFYGSATSNSDLYEVALKAPAPVVGAPTITTQPVSAVYMKDDAASALTVAATASKGSLSYRWYSCDDAEKTNPAAIAGETSASYTPSTSATGSFYFFCRVSDDNGSTDSNVATIEVVTGLAPEVSATISASIVRAGATVTLTATVDAGIPAPTLQWYTCDVDGTNEAAIDGATNTTYQPSAASVGTFYFKVKAHNDSGDDYSDVLKLTVIAQGSSGAVSDLETISSNYTFIADNHTGNGVVGFASGFLYDENRIFSPLGNSVATNKGKSTIDGVNYFNSLRLKKNDQDVLAFKVGGACTIVFYTENPGKTRPIKVGNAVDDDSYGTISDANEEHIVYIPSATTVYLTGTGDRFIAGFKVIFTVSATIGSTGYASFSSTYALDFSGVEGLKAFIATTGGETTVTMEQVDDAAAGTGLVLKGAAGTYNIPVVASATDHSATNRLWAITSNQNVTAAGTGWTNYVLAKQNGNVVFAPVTGENSVAVTAGHAALCLQNPSGSRALRMVFDDVTGINAVNNERLTANDPMYDLQGRRVVQPTKGLYIVDGRKVVVK